MPLINNQTADEKSHLASIIGLEDVISFGKEVTHQFSFKGAHLQGDLQMCDVQSKDQKTKKKKRKNEGK